MIKKKTNLNTLPSENGKNDVPHHAIASLARCALSLIMLLSSRRSAGLLTPTLPADFETKLNLYLA